MKTTFTDIDYGMGLQPMHHGMTFKSDKSPFRAPAPIPSNAWAGCPCHIPTFYLLPFTFYSPAGRFAP